MICNVSAERFIELFASYVLLPIIRKGRIRENPAAWFPKGSLIAHWEVSRNPESILSQEA
jgi:hypothetical protein